MPEQQVPQEQLTPELENSQGTEQEKLSQQIPPTVPQPDARISALENSNKNLESKLDSVLNMLQQQNARHVEQATVQAPKVELPSNKEVWDNPVDAIGKIVAAQTAPLNEAAKELMRGSRVTAVMNQLKSSPQYQRAKELYPSFEAQLESQLSQVPVEQLNANSAAFVFSSTVGQLALAAPVQVPNPAQVVPQTPGNAAPVNIPAHLRPTPSTPPVKKPDEQEPELTENETILARRYGMTPKEYKAMQSGNRMALNPLDAGKGA